MKTLIMNSALAGVLIAIGGTVYLQCENKVIGAIFFSVALLCICLEEYYLFTGSIGYAFCTKRSIKTLGIMLAVNLLTVFICGLFYEQNAADIVKAKLELNLVQVFWEAFGCGVLMFLAVDIYKRHKKEIGILFCVPTFILCGFEHSIADTFYFAAAREFSLKALAFIAVAVIGNSAGAILFNRITKKAQFRK